MERHTRRPLLGQSPKTALAPTGKQRKSNQDVHTKVAVSPSSLSLTFYEMGIKKITGWHLTLQMPIGEMGQKMSEEIAEPGFE
ncbi:MAG: hypothetical protein KF734_19900 [Saprospiraceae bacterium]|nr:hypothetical protein [Saprospiraceae bacterium]